MPFFSNSTSSCGAVCVLHSPYKKAICTDSQLLNLPTSCCACCACFDAAQPHKSTHAATVRKGANIVLLRVMAFTICHFHAGPAVLSLEQPALCQQFWQHVFVYNQAAAVELGYIWEAILNMIAFSDHTPHCRTACQCSVAVYCPACVAAATCCIYRQPVT